MDGAIVVAGGRGERFGAGDGKQFATVAGKPLVAHALLALQACDAVDAVVLVIGSDHVDAARTSLVEGLGLDKVVAVVAGGATRRDSVAAGLAAMPEDAEAVAVHDGARPLVTPQVFEEAFRALRTRGLDGIVVGHPVVDTVKRVDESGIVVGTPERAGLWAAHTPQVFVATVLRDAYARALEDGAEATDDAALVARCAGEVGMLKGPRDNLKVTVPEDIPVVEAVLARRAGGHEEA